MSQESLVSARSAAGPHRRVLGLDIGSSLGWCVVDAGASTTIAGSGVVRIQGSGGARWAFARRTFHDLLERWRPESIAYELVMRHVSSGSARVYWALVAALELACIGREQDLVPCAVPHVKQRLAGKGNADKAAMIAAARPWLGRDPVTSDEADAVGVALLGADRWRTP